MEKQWKCYTQAFRDTWIRVLRSDVNLQISDGTITGLFLRSPIGCYALLILCVAFALPKD